MSNKQQIKTILLSGVLALGGALSLPAIAAPDAIVKRTVVVQRPAPVRNVVARTAATVVLSTLPAQHTRVVHSGRTYFLADGVYYVREPRGYVVTTPRAGVSLRSLPRGAVVVRNGSRVTYRYKGVNYRRSGGFYVVI